MTPRWNILYRGPLTSCNYACGYCPFAKARMTAAELRDDAVKLERFVTWAAGRTERQLGVLFTPWGEALVHRNYQQAMLRLGDQPHVYRVAIQTNLSCALDWLADANRATVALWCTYHPTETKLEQFAAKIHRLQAMGIRHSVGVVGIREHFDGIARLREALPAKTYMWINAFKREADYYSDDDVRWLGSVDSLFHLNTIRHPSLGRPCEAGASSFTVDGDGIARRCHFVAAPLGCVYEEGFSERLARAAAPCPNATCGCHIGYVYLRDLALDRVFGEGILDRVPLEKPAAEDH
jgi:MoaA/NifB/PqqE/SkfB family radical SAM enzyme